MVTAALVASLLTSISRCENVETETLIVENNTDHALTIVKLSPAEEFRLSPPVAPHSRVVTNGIKCGISPLMGPTTSDAQEILRFVRSIWHEARTPDGTLLATLPYSQDCDPADPWVIE